jgi:tRNA(Ile)-lysidine synthase
MILESILLTQCGLDPAKAVLAGISGGPDSLCLLGVLREAGYRVIVAHFNHRLRPEADAEAEAIAELARRLDVPFVSDRADVRGYAEKQSLSLEEAARSLRYRFLFAAARQHSAQAVAVGHTADDQVETVLMHFLRGAGLTGLKGMEYRTLLPSFDPSIPLVRPLLALRREETEAYCRQQALEPHFDQSNLDPAYFRNRLRHVLIPVLEGYNPRFKEALLRTAQSLQSDHAALQELLESAWQGVILSSTETLVEFNRPGLAALPRGLRRNLIRKAGELLRPESRDFGFDALERAASFAESPTGQQVAFASGLYLFSEQDGIFLAASEADLPLAQWPQVKQLIVILYSLFANGDRQIELGNGWILTVEEMPRNAETWRLNDDNWSAWLDAERLPAGEFVIRPRQPGDTFAPLGMGGQTVKVRDVYINQKIPRRARPHWPLVCVGGQVVWVAGYRIAQPFRVTEETRRVLHLELKRLPGE